MYPTRFILSIDVMTRALNYIFQGDFFMGYGIHKLIPNLNHLAYADGTIIFTSSNAYSLERLC